LTATDLIERRRAEFVEALDAALPPGRSVALLDIPHFANVGDNAILLGELAALRALGRRVLHLPTPGGSYERSRLLRRIGGRPILLHGGGNFGDLWPAHQRLRERVLADFPDHHIVQLPQSIAFASETSVARARAALANDERFTLMVRDEPSRQFAMEYLAVGARLVPDAAFALGALRRTRPATRDVLVLARTDHEARPDRQLPAGVAPEDWVDARLGARARILQALAGEIDRRPGRTAAMSAALARASMYTRSRVSGRHLSNGLDLLSTATVVVTDRLHAHLLALLLGIPSFVTDNVSGKIRGLYDAWTRESNLVTWVDSLQEGVAVAKGRPPAT
jgi:pyruvyl transferase EpsO